MCNLIPKEIWNCTRKLFFEPTCGNGAFLTEILKRKLENINEISKNNSLTLLDTIFYKIIALQSIYGVDIMEDNVIEARKRLKKILSNNEITKKNIGELGMKVIDTILERNIIVGDTLKGIDKNNEPLRFFDWKENKYVLLSEMNDNKKQKSLFDFTNK